jgi:type VI secretion system protein ImpB
LEAQEFAVTAEVGPPRGADADAIARKVGPLRKLLEARERLSHLLSYMDGKDSAEQLISRLLNDRGLQEALAGQRAEKGDAAN